MMKHKLFIGLLILVLGISSCGPLGSAPSGEGNTPRAWFDAPLPGTVVRPPNPCQIVAHGASPNGIAAFELTINGTVPTNIPSPDTQTSLVTLTRDCGLTQPGEYHLQMRAQDKAGNWSGFAETSLTILGGETPSAESPATEPSVTETPTATAEGTGGVSVESISTNLVYYGGSSCGTQEVTITARAVDPKGIKVVVLFYRFASSNASAEFQSVAMNPIGGDLYRRTLNPTSILGGLISFDQATLNYQIVIQQNDGDTSIRTPVLTDITVQACGSVTASCSSYTDQRACEAHGCNWVPIPGSVPVYACRKP